MTTLTAPAIDRQSIIKFNNIPNDMRSVPNWAFYCGKKFPITLSAVARGWPITGWNDGLEGARAKAGARSNDPSTWGLFEDCHSIWHCGPDPLVAGPTFALQTQLEIVVIDLDDPVRSLRNKRAINGGPLSDGLKQQLLEAARQSQAEVLELFAGHYIERSYSGLGHHIFLRGAMPQGYERCKFSFHGSVFSTGQFINMTGNVDERVSGIKGGDDLADGSWALTRFVELFSALGKGGQMDKTDVLLVPVARDDDSKCGDGADGDAVEYLLHDNYERYGRRTDLEDSEVVGKLSKGMQAVWGGGSITGDHSEDTFHLLGDLEKITGSAAQIERLMKQSPRMQHCGFGNDGQPRWQKHFGSNFNRNLLKVRRSNDEKFAEWEAKGTWLSPERREWARAAFERICGPDDPGSLAFKAAKAAEKEQAKCTESARVINKLGEIAEKSRVDWEKEWQHNRRYTRRAIKAMQQLLHALEIDDYMQENKWPPGLAGWLCYYVNEGMYEPFAKFSIPATLTGLGGIIGRKFKTSDGHGLQIFITVLAKSTIGKSEAIASFRKIISELAIIAQCKIRFFDQPVTSKQGFHETLEEIPCFTWVRDEASHDLRMIMAPDQRDTAAHNMQSLLNRLFDLGSVGGEPYRPSASVRSKNAGDKIVRNLCVSGFWGTTLVNVNTFMTPDTVGSGLTSRMLFVSHRKAGGGFDPKRVRLNTLPQGQAGSVEETLRQRLMTLCAMADTLDEKYGYLPKEGEIYDNAKAVDESRDLTIVRLDAEALAFWNQLQVNISKFKALVANGESEFVDHYLAFGRAGMIAHRIASILAVLENPVAPVVKLEGFKWGYGYVLQLLGGMISDFDTGESGAIDADAPKVAIRIMKNCIKAGLVDGSINGGVIGYGTYRKKVMDDTFFRRTGKEVAGSVKRAVDLVMEELAERGMFEYRRFDTLPDGSLGRVIGKEEVIVLRDHPDWYDENS